MGIQRMRLDELKLFLTRGADRRERFRPEYDETLPEKAQSAGFP